jgi:hypothetical protein
MFDRGSEWRRWDLHVHTPESALANHYGDWPSYIDALEAKGVGVSVIGITDYCSIEGYKKVVEARTAGRLSGFDLVIPNIEFRTHPEMGNGRAINLHILLDPDAQEAVAEIEQCLGLLTFEYNGIHYPCSTEGLRRLGRAVDGTQTDAWGAFKVGVNAFKPDFVAIRRWLDNEGRWLRRNGFVVVANGKDGPSGLSKDAGFAAVREELYRCADMIFSGNPADRLYFLGQGSDDVAKVKEKNGSLKPCIHGSDAHDEDKLFQPDNDRYCWIKAKPTFEGLRQLLHEPEHRVVVGPTPPSPTDTSKIIDYVTLAGAPGWFADETIHLNPGLVTIIGEKGSGKTALAELIAFATAAWKSEGSPASFITKAAPTIDDLVVAVTWANGDVTSRRVGDGRAGNLPRIRYLSQDFVEELCSNDFSGSRLIREIEDVVFGYINEGDRLDSSDFAGLRRLTTDNITQRKREVNARISTINREILAIDERLAGRTEKQMLLQRTADDLAAIDAQLPALQVSVDLAVAAEIDRLNGIRKDKSALVANANRRLTRLTTTRAKTSDFVAATERAFLELRPALIEIGFTDAEAERLRPMIPLDALSPFEPIETQISQEVAALSGQAEAPDPAGETIVDLDHRLEMLNALLATDEQQRLRLIDLQKHRARIEGDRHRLEAEIANLDGTVTEELAAKIEERWAKYLSFFDLLDEERAQLAKLYEPLKKVIPADGDGAEAGFELDVRLSAAPGEWIEVGRDMFDKRRNGVALANDGVLKETRRSLFEAWQSADRQAIRLSLEWLMAQMGSPFVISEQLLAHASLERVNDWLFSTDHITLDYGLKYRGTDLERLSPGTRGIVLLVLYLAMDRQDRRPLIIDQPEGNLDNSSIYEALVPFLRKAKLTRQVILVSHNPNLVVTTDADQVLVAHADRPEGARHPIISYAAGALEDAGTEEAIRAQTVKLLEGGRDPFKTREKRYALTN